MALFGPLALDGMRGRMGGRRFGEFDGDGFDFDPETMGRATRPATTGAPALGIPAAPAAGGLPFSAYLNPGAQTTQRTQLFGPLANLGVAGQFGQLPVKRPFRGFGPGGIDVGRQGAI